MLLPDQVIPFLQHDDPAVRAHAAHYLSRAHDPAPATADDFWRAIDRFGTGQSSVFLSELAELPPTDSSYQRLMDALRSAPTEAVAHHLQRAVERLDFPLLLAHRDEIRSSPSIPPEAREHLRRRLDLADSPVDTVWDALLRHSEASDDKNAGEIDARESDRLVEATARHGEPAAARALDRLRDGPRGDWMEIFCVQVLGALRFAPAACLLVERLRTDADVLREELDRALARIGTVEVVEQLEAFYPRQPWDARLYAIDPLGRIKRPESERALLRLLPRETDKQLPTHLAEALCDLCTTEGLDAVGRMVADGRYDAGYTDLDELFLSACTMAGHEPPNAADLRRRVEARRRERERRLQSPASLEEMIREIRDRLRQGERGWKPVGRDTRLAGDHDPLGPGGDAWVAGSGSGAGAPVRREARKTGRNDPCPCGSGRKYKKCCLSGAEA